jgi:hypothetical protein
MRCPEHPTVEIVEPCVIRANDTLETRSGGGFDEPSPAVPADIVKCPQLPLRIAKDQDAGAGDLYREEVSRFGNLVLPANTLPRLLEEPLDFPLVDTGIAEEWTRKRSRLMEGPSHGLECPR